MARFGHGCISPFFLGTATTLAIWSAPLAVLSLTSEGTKKPEVQLAVWALVVCCGLLIPLISDIFAQRARRKRQDDSAPGDTAGTIVAGTCVMALLSWWAIVRNLPGSVPDGAALVAFRMAMYVGVFAAVSIPTLFTRSYRVNERSIALGVALGIILALTTT